MYAYIAERLEPIFKAVVRLGYRKPMFRTYAYSGNSRNRGKVVMKILLNRDGAWKSPPHQNQRFV